MCCCAATPVPLSEIVDGEFVALLVIDTLPLTAPPAVGSNVTVNVADWFGLRISPAVTPLDVNPAPVTFTAEIATLAFPVFVTARLSELLLPVFTLPKFRFVVLRLSECVDATPVPLSAIARGELGELLVITTEPLTAPAAVGAKVMLNVILPPALIVNGALIPETPNPAPVNVTCEIVAAAVPEFESVTVCELLCPVVTFPNAALFGLADSCEDVPVPLNAIVVGEFGALLTIEMLPVALPDPVGAYTALNVAVCPAVNVTGAEIPEMLNPAPDALICDIVSDAVPPFLSEIGCELLLPAATLPKFSDAGDAASCACAPVPVSAIVIGELGESFVIVMLPLAAPAVVGANCAVNDALCPAPSVAGVANPVTLKPVPLAAICEMFTFAEPEFVSVTVCVALLPSVTEPKATLFGFAVSCPCTPVPASATDAGDPAALLTIEIDPVAPPAAVGLNTAVNDAVLPALIVIGIDPPVMLKPAPDAIACVTVSVALPEFVSETVCVPVPPTATFPKLTFAGFSVSCACPAVPVPLNAIVSGDPCTLLAIEMLPLVAPAVVGANFTPNAAV